ncbi:hypothetical protein ACTFIU_007589 [Dictyostelium citrinum]
MYIQISLIIIFSLICGSNSLVSNYVPVIGRDLINPADITRAALPTYTNQNDALLFAKNIVGEIAGDVYNITFSKYYLNNIIALSTSDSFGGLPHYSSLLTLYNDVYNIAHLSLNNSINCINIVSKFNNFDTSKFDSISSSINNLKSSIDSIKQSATLLATAMNTTKNSLSSSSNTAMVEIVKDNYDLVIKSVLSIADRLNIMKAPLNDMISIMSLMKEEVTFYVDFLTTDSDYMGNMNTYMKNLLKYSNTLYNKSFLFTRLKELF